MTAAVEHRKSQVFSLRLGLELDPISSCKPLCVRPPVSYKIPSPLHGELAVSIAHLSAHLLLDKFEAKLLFVLTRSRIHSSPLPTHSPTPPPSSCLFISRTIYQPTPTVCFPDCPAASPILYSARLFASHPRSGSHQSLLSGFALSLSAAHSLCSPSRPDSAIRLNLIYLQSISTPHNSTCLRFALSL